MKMRSLLLVCLLVVTLTVAIAAPTQEGSETGKGKKDDQTKGKVKRSNCVKKDNWTPTTNKPICIRRPVTPGVVSLLEGDEDAGGGQATTVWGRFGKGEEKVDRKKRSRNVLWSRTPLRGNSSDNQANAVWERIHGKTHNENATYPPDTLIREERQVEANPKRRPRPCLGCLSLIGAKKEAPTKHTADPVLM
ncbi:hypothetical protein AOXY_G3965 [Acipenser oxyrinchus oxyrinchus]|uniref:Secreted protein n=1 Tax=Acipenser oxyrinchus oxyrinchus TaxID=40147 RepID=A0AAD8LT05_ACIOX|nr:hypothetical protein AOXY_G3965 [Acipenser oxyrinchus oxyrinchus]